MIKLDWNKTKTIFIIVFSILNVFLYTLYLNRHMEAQNLQVNWETSIEDALRSDNISIGRLPDGNGESSYISAKIDIFTDGQLGKLQNQVFDVVDETYLFSRFKVPVSMQKEKEKGDYDFQDFLSTYVLRGEEYVLWEVNEDKRQALFFQKVEDNPIFFNQNAQLIVYWNEDKKVTNYEQRMFGEFVSYNKKKDLLAPMQAINTLYSRNYLKPDSTLKKMSLGYSSTLIQPTKTQVFAPTWHVRVELKDGTIEDHFINAIEGKILEFKSDPIEEENE